MTSLIVAYLMAWVALGGYLAWLGAQQNHLHRRMQEMEALTHSKEAWRKAA